MIHKTLNHYKIIDKLGKGGMGEVYLAEDTRLKRKVALKVLPQEMASNVERLARFQREAESIAALNHPNVVTIYSVEEAKGIHFLTMELIEGATIAQLISQEGMDLETLSGLAISITSALSAAHEKGIIHRDIKPANIMVTKDGRAKILDFGLAKIQRMEEAQSELETSIKTQYGVVMGTTPYMSPEQILGQDLDARSDIFSLGIVLYQLASGQYPFESTSAAKIMADILHTHVPSLDSKVPRELGKIILRCLEKDRDQRYPSMNDLLADLLVYRDRLQLSKKLPEMLRSQETPTHNLPIQVTTFVGRKRELEELKQLLSLHRLVTVIGAGGSGKTRLAFEVAFQSLADFEDGVWQVSLATIALPELVLQTIVEGLQASKQPERSLQENLAIRLEGRKMLIVVDNCEHVLNETARVVDLILRISPQLRILTTSREALNVAGECVWTVPSLSFPAPQAGMSLESAMRYDAIRLFVERAIARDPRFTLNESNLDAVSGISARMDGIPLAIELAAARVNVMSAAEIHKRLNDCFKLLTGGSRTSLARHQTLKATVDWSYDLLSPNEQTLFRKLACFVGGFDLEAVENVCGSTDVIDPLTHLIEKSLVVSERSITDVVRYRLLEPLRQYASDKLSGSGELDELKRRHFMYYSELADRAYEERIEAGTSWLDRLEMEHDNLRAALNFASSQEDESELRLAGALGWFWQSHSHFSEGRRWLRHALARPWLRSRNAARALCSASYLAAFLGDYSEGHEPAQEGLAIWKELGESREIALALETRGWNIWFSGDNASAMNAFEECLRIFQAENDERLVNRANLNICQVLVSEFDVEKAEPLARRSLPIAIQYDDPRDIHFAYHFIADCALIRGDVVSARSGYADALRAAVRYGDRFEMLFEIEGIAMALAGLGHDEKALRLVAAADAEHKLQSSNVTISFWQALKERYLLPSEARLGAERTTQEKRAGSLMRLEAAIEYALEQEGSAGVPPA